MPDAKNHLVRKQMLKHLAKLTKWLSSVLSTYLYCAFDYMFLTCHARVSEKIHTLYMPDANNVLAQSRCEIWTLNNFNWTRNQNHLVRKRTLNDLTKETKWLSCVLSTYLYGAFDCIFLLCRVRVLEWMSRNSLLEIWGFGDCSCTQSQSHLVWKQTLNRFTKLTK